jgi:hypothetical protein
MAIPLNSPTRCLSSRLTTELLKFRNQHGAEENWLEANRSSPGMIFFGLRVMTTEIGVAILCVTATVETVAYGVLALSSYLITPIHRAPFNRAVELLQSSAFTIYWNFGNTLIFNPFCKEVFTHESFARFTIDEWPRGFALKTVAYVSFCFLVAIIGRVPVGLYRSGTFNLIRVTRQSDSLYIADWTRRYGSQLFRAPGPAPRGAQDQADIHNIFRQAVRQGQGLNDRIDAGAAFFREYILGQNRIAEESKQLIFECDPDIYHFVLTRAVYVYVFGEKRNADVPSFFGRETQDHITRLRRQYRQNEGNRLADAMKNHTVFEQTQDPLLTQLKTAASPELQGNIFATRCWQKACENP